MLGVRPTLTLWQNMYRLVEMMGGVTTLLGGGSWSNKGIERYSVFPLVRKASGGSSPLYTLVEIGEEIAACYMQMKSKIFRGEEIFVVSNWLPNCRLFKNEHLLSAMGLSRTFPKSNSPRGVFGCNCHVSLVLLVTNCLFLFQLPPEHIK